MIEGHDKRIETSSKQGISMVRCWPRTPSYSSDSIQESVSLSRWMLRETVRQQPVLAALALGLVGVYGQHECQVQSVVREARFVPLNRSSRPV